MTCLIVDQEFKFGEHLNLILYVKCETSQTNKL